MKTNRREFLTTGIKVAATTSILGIPNLASGYASIEMMKSVEPEPNPLKILILGGTSFLGPHQIAYAMSKGHSITTFTRGRTKPTIHRDLFKEVEPLIGDRENNLEALKGRKWDAVIDNSGRKVEWTRDTAELLKDNVGIYLYTSSTGVYYPYLGSDIKEDTKLVTEVPTEMTEYQKIEYEYGVMKTNSEIEAKKAFGDDNTIVVRPTYMMGPADRTDRFTYWPIRVAKGGEILVPGKSDDPVQYIDVRDVAGFMIRLIEKRKAGIFNAVGPASTTGMHAFVYGVHSAFSSKADFVSIDDYEFLKQNNLLWAIPWIMPEGDNYGSARASNEHSVSNGLSFRPLAESCIDIHNWWYSDAVEEDRRMKMTSDSNSLFVREPDIIKAWNNRN